MHATETCYDPDSEDTQEVETHRGSIILRRTLCGIPLTYLIATDERGGFSPKPVFRSTEAITCLACIGAS